MCRKYTSHRLIFGYIETNIDCIIVIVVDVLELASEVQLLPKAECSGPQSCGDSLISGSSASALLGGEIPPTFQPSGPLK